MKHKKQRIKPYSPTAQSLAKGRQELARARQEFEKNEREVRHALKTDPLFYQRIERVVAIAKKYISQNKDGIICFPRLPILKVDRKTINDFTPEKLTEVFVTCGSVMPFVLYPEGDIYPIMSKHMLEKCWFEDGYNPNLEATTKTETKTIIQEKKVIDNSKVDKVLEKAKRQIKATSFQLEAIENFIQIVKASL